MPIIDLTNVWEMPIIDFTNVWKMPILDFTNVWEIQLLTYRCRINSKQVIQDAIKGFYTNIAMFVYVDSAALAVDIVIL